MVSVNAAGTWSATIVNDRWESVLIWLLGNNIVYHTGWLQGEWGGPFTRTYYFNSAEDHMLFTLTWSELLVYA